MADQERDRNVPEPHRETDEERRAGTTPPRSGERAAGEPPVTQRPSTPQGQVRATATQRVEEEFPTWQPGERPPAEEGAIEKARGTAEEALGAAEQRAKSTLGTQKVRAADSLTDVSHALRRTIDQLREEEHEGIASYAERAAEQVDRFSESLRTKSVDEILSDVQDYAHRQPEVFLGGAFVLGLLGARFLKSSRRPSSERVTVPTGHETRPAEPGYTALSYSRPYDTPYTGQTPTTPASPPSEMGTHPLEGERRDE